MLSTLLSRYVQRCRLVARLMMLLVLITCTSCTAFNLSRDTASTVELSIRQAEASGRPGTYVVSGSTTLPEKTRITVAAVRDFQSSEATETRQVYAILDRQFAEVQQGNWETTLNLWQVAPDGRFQENWQLSNASAAAAEPVPTVTFLATLDPINQPPTLKDQFESQDNATQATLARFTTDGELYLEASKRLNIPLPSGRTTPPAATAPSQPRTSGQPANPTANQNRAGWSQTSAPLVPDQLLR